MGHHQRFDLQQYPVFHQSAPASSTICSLFRIHAPAAAFMYKPGFRIYKYREETVYEKCPKIYGGKRLGDARAQRKMGKREFFHRSLSLFQRLAQERLEIYGDLAIRLFKASPSTYTATTQDSRSAVASERWSDAGGSAPEAQTAGNQLQLLRIDRLSYTFGSIFSNVVNPRFTGIEPVGRLRRYHRVDCNCLAGGPNMEKRTSKAQRSRRISKPDLRLVRLQALRSGGCNSLEIL